MNQIDWSVSDSEAVDGVKQSFVFVSITFNLALNQKSQARFKDNIHQRRLGQIRPLLFCLLTIC